MARVNWSRFQQILRRHALMEYMMDTTGVHLPTAVPAGDGFVEARAKCADCPHEQGCRDWILKSKGAVRSPPEFCANAEFFRDCKHDDC